MIEFKNIQQLIDYTNLDDSINLNDIKKHCIKALQYNVKAICIWPQFVKEAKAILYNSSIKVCTVISFPLGINSKNEKEIETHQAINDGADEIDIVFNYQLLLMNWINNQLPIQIKKQLIDEVNCIASICHSNNTILKVIIESGILTIPQTIEATKICIEANTDFIKTSTGKGGLQGAELEKVKAIKNTIINCNALETVSIKISGGIQMNDSLNKFLDLDIQRIGIGYKKFDEYMINHKI